MAGTGIQGRRGRFQGLSVIGVIAILGLTYGLSTLLGPAITAPLLAREAQVKQEFLNSILAAEASAGSLFAQPASSPALTSFSTHVRSLSGIVRANIYSPDGYIRASTDPNLIGLQFGANEELADAFSGKITSALETPSGDVKSEHLALNQVAGEELIEAYIPVAGPDGKIAVVVEFYQKDTWIRNTITLVERAMWLLAGLSSVILVLLLAVATRKARPIGVMTSPLFVTQVTAASVRRD